MFDKLRQIEERYGELNRTLSDPQVIGQPAVYARTAKAAADLAETVAKFEEYKSVLARTSEARHILAEDADREMRDLAQAEIDELGARQAKLEEELRGLLPEHVSHADATFNASRSALLVAALTGHGEALLAATDDRLHQPHRAEAMHESAALVAKLRAAGLPAVISGAGPSVLVLARGAAEADAATAQAPDGWRVEQAAVASVGAHLVR